MLLRYRNNMKRKIFLKPSAQIYLEIKQQNQESKYKY